MVKAPKSKRIKRTEAMVDRILTAMNVFHKPAVDGFGTHIVYISNNEKTEQYEREYILAFMNEDIMLAVASLNNFLVNTDQRPLSIQRETVIARDGEHPYKVGYHVSRHDMTALYSVCEVGSDYVSEIISQMGSNPP